MKRAAQLYLVIVSIVGLGIFFILHVGSQLPPPVSRLSTEPVAATTPHLTDGSNSSFFASVESNLQQSATNPLSRLFLQLLIIIGASGVVAWIFTRCGQPVVIGEMVAGILSQHIFTMLVIMALVTTIMTGPLVTFFGRTRGMAAA